MLIFFEGLIMKRIYLLMVAILIAMISVNVIAKDFSASEKKSIEKIVHNYLVNHPEVLLEAQKTYRKKVMAEMDANASKVIKENLSTLLDAGISPVVGKASGTITLVEFFDYYCGHCRNMQPVVEKLIKHNPKLRVISRVTPIFGDKSELIAKIILAANMQGKYAVLNKIYLDNANAAKMNDKDGLLSLAKDAGLDMKKLAKDMASDAVKNEIASSLKLLDKITSGSSGTPVFIVARTDAKTNLDKIKYLPGAVPENVLQKAIRDNE
jgi:protein-disulfide isomerase